MSFDMFPDSAIEYLITHQEDTVASDDCNNCGKKIEVAIFKGSGHCSDDCRKVLAGETARPTAQTDAGITNLLKQPEGINPRGIS
jgi:hypothetical protein